MRIQDLPRTRRVLHGVAELVLAGPQYRLSGTIRLRPVSGGFATVTAPHLRVDGDTLVTGTGLVLPLRDVTFAGLAEAAGVQVGAPEGLYRDGSGVQADERVEVDPAAVEYIADCLAIGETALRRLDPELTPVLWPEHFDLGVSSDEINYGVSLGNSTIEEPYAYVGPWQAREGAFWNMTFGAARPISELGGADAVTAFLEEGRRQAHDRD
ncbi:hypothetical protein [Microtetraspora sp. NBRC 16547]|uniref:hypothetical protein n=1 Tax=Microtetraspora sp. NBRC 16547 TaxID=3030993 RepID=UPI0024A37A77|nr:hypothetical protein [Microtetraspora sp. NBRC 16547]GLX01381.1 hypothetical protein Misp02_54670 [Microtetraspora sp. NBRC 16547]